MHESGIHTASAELDRNHPEAPDKKDGQRNVVLEKTSFQTEKAIQSLEK